MLGSDFLKTREVLPRGIRVTFSQIGARDAKFRRGVIGKRGYGFLKFGDGFVVALELRLQGAKKIMSVGFGRNLRDVLQCFDALFGLCGSFVKEAEGLPLV